MKKHIAVIAFVLLLGLGTRADSQVRFFWSVGDMGVSFNAMSAKLTPAFDITAGNFNWITRSGFGWRFNLFTLQGDASGSHALILPAEINYSPLGDREEGLFLTLYARGGLLTRFLREYEAEQPFFERSSFFGAAGLRFAWIPQVGKHWAVFNSAYVEYTTRNELRLGLSIDLATVTLLVGTGWLISLAD